MSFAARTLFANNQFRTDFLLTPGFFDNGSGALFTGYVNAVFGASAPGPAPIFSTSVPQIYWVTSGLGENTQVITAAALPAAITSVDIFVGGVFFANAARNTSVQFVYFSATNPFTAGVPVAIRLEFK